MGRPAKEDSKYTTENGNTRYYSSIKAKRKYESNNYDKVMVRMPKGSTDKIKELTGKAPATFLKECALAELERL